MTDEAIEKCYPTGKLELTVDEFECVAVEVCGFPKFFRNLLFDRIDSGKSGKVTKQ